MYGSLSICLSGSAPQFVAISLLVISIKRPPDKQSGSEINYVDVQACKAPRVQGLEGVRPSLWPEPTMRWLAHFSVLDFFFFFFNIFIGV